MALLAIDLGRRGPVGDPFVEGIEKMIAAAACSGGAFGAALLARARLRLGTRVAGCAGMALAAAASLAIAWPPRAQVGWRRVGALSGSWSIEFPAPADRAQRTAKTASGEEEEHELFARVAGATFLARESEPSRGAPGLPGASPDELLRRARAAALPSGRERILEERALAPAASASPPLDAAGLELRFRLDGHDHLARLYAAPGRLVVLTAGPLDRAGPEAAQRFLDSFRWTRSDR